MCSQSVFRKRERPLRWLAEEFFPQLDAILRTAGDGIEDAFERGLEAALAEPREAVRSRPEEIRVREVKFRLAVLLIAAIGVTWVAVLGG